jgi:hypothetical protein
LQRQPRTAPASPQWKKPGVEKARGIHKLSVLERGHSCPQVAYAGPRAHKNVGAPFANPSPRRQLVDALEIAGRFLVSRRFLVASAEGV